MGSDHGGLSHKNVIKQFLLTQGHEVIDFGTNTEDSVDYNDYGIKVAQAVRDKEVDKGILVCGTGIGMSIMANKVEGVRAALVHDLFTAEATRQHNDSNVLAMGGRVISEELALKIADIWVNTPFSNEERHIRRIKKIMDYKGE
jgi:ribose 5-phosphate isomerase B